MGMFNFVLDSFKGEIFDFKVNRRGLVASTVYLLTYMDIYGHLWASMVVFKDGYGHLWTSMNIYGHLWTYIDIYRHLWTYIDIYRHL